MSGCDLCGLPTPDPPIRDPDTRRTFCCRGCKHVATTVDAAAADRPEQSDSSTGQTPDVPPDADEVYFVVDGMHCTSCERFLGSRAAGIDDVYAVDANYGLGTARVHFDADAVEPAAIAPRLSGAGYTFRERHAGDAAGTASARNRDTVQRLVVGGFLSMLIMPWYFFSLYPIYLGFEHGILDMGRTTTVGTYFPLVVIGMFTTVVLAYTGFPVLRGAWISLRTRQPNMDLLVSIAAVSAYAYSVLALLLGSTHLYFDVSVMVIMVVTLGRYYEDSLRGDATAELTAITSARVNEAVRMRPDGREAVSIDEVSPGDRLLVQPGERIPLDGQVVSGQADVDEALLTGESLPTAKGPGDDVVGGAIVLDDALVVTVGPDADSTMDRIARAMWSIQADGGGIQRFADALATIFVPLVLVLGVVVTGYHLLIGSTVAAALLFGLTILIVSCPCAMGLATPLAISAGLRDALRRGIVVTNATVFEIAPDPDVMIFDKTGTLTTGEMEVNDVHGHEETLFRAAAVERYASHPVADAILEASNRDAPVRTDGGLSASESATLTLPDCEAFERHPGAGVSGIVDGDRTVVGTLDFVEREVGSVGDRLRTAAAAIEDRGGLATVVGWDGGRGIIGITDGAREQWDAVLDRFADADLVILSGDETAEEAIFADHDAVDHVFAGVPPDGKVATVERFLARGTTVMVGDGTNDAPALARADLGVALGEGTADASAGADVVLMDDGIASLPAVFDLARTTKRRIRENVAWALLYNAIALPLAIVGLINPFFAAVAMAISSIIVVSNSRRPVLR